ncbi:MAG: hypothetical protein AAF456_13990 [Planctomycetota bacterium]
MSNLARKFKLPAPLFSPDSAWRQPVRDVAIRENNSRFIHEMFQMLRGHQQNFCYLNYDDFTIPVFKSNPEPDCENNRIELLNYWGDSWASSTLAGQMLEEDGKRFICGVPQPAAIVRPSGPQSTDADGHLVLVDIEKGTSWEFWHATTRFEVETSAGGGFNGEKVLQSGAIEKFVLDGQGAQRPAGTCQFRGSARATGVSLLAGLLLPEDFQSRAIEHAMVFSIPRLRHVYPVHDTTQYDYVYPATKTETSAYNGSPWAMGGGERIRLKDELFDRNGQPLAVHSFSNATRKLLDALREFGAYLVDGGGGFGFYAEDYRTGNLALPENEFEELTASTHRDECEITCRESQWHYLVQLLNCEFQQVPFAVLKEGQIVSNFDFVENAIVPDGFNTVCTVGAINEEVDYSVHG